MSEDSSDTTNSEDDIGRQVNDVYSDYDLREAEAARAAKLLLGLDQIIAPLKPFEVKGKSSDKIPLFSRTALEISQLLSANTPEPQLVVEEDGSAYRLRRIFINGDYLSNYSDADKIPIAFVDTIDVPEQPYHVEIDFTQLGGRYYRYENGRLRVRKPDGTYRRITPGAYASFLKNVERLYTSPDLLEIIESHDSIKHRH